MFALQKGFVWIASVLRGHEKIPTAFTLQSIAPETDLNTNAARSGGNRNHIQVLFQKAREKR